MKLYHVVAMARNRVIGKNNKLPWHFPADLKHFKNLTTGSTVIMGRKTFESIGKPLPNRENFVLTRSGTVNVPVANNLHFFDSIENALEKVATNTAYIIGGATLYAQTMNLVQGIYLTYIDEDHEGDAFYPKIPDGFEKKPGNQIGGNPLLEAVYYENRGGLIREVRI